MREKMLQKDTEDIRPEDTNTTVSGSNKQINGIDLSDDPSDSTGSGEDQRGLLPMRFNNQTFILKILMPVCGAALVILALLIAGSSGKKADLNEPQEPYISSRPRQDVMTDTKGAEPLEMTTEKLKDDKVEASVSPDDERENEEFAELVQKLENQYRALHNTIFGEGSLSSSLGCVTAVTGLTDREKREIGFLEADFLKDAGAFLTDQHIQTKRIIIEDRIANSSDAGIAFQGRLEGKDDYILEIVFYPDLPGDYVFLLRNVKGNERGAGNQSTAGSTTVNTDQNGGQAQITAPAPEESQTVIVPQNMQPEIAGQNSYDATALSIRKIPEILLNYIDNRYEFQYSLYDWLYNHGKKNVESASVTDYSIDGDARQAKIKLKLSDGSSLTAVYDKTADSYSFKR